MTGLGWFPPPLTHGCQLTNLHAFTLATVEGVLVGLGWNYFLPDPPHLYVGGSRGLTSSPPVPQVLAMGRRQGQHPHICGGTARHLDIDHLIWSNGDPQRLSKWSIPAGGDPSRDLFERLVHRRCSPTVTQQVHMSGTAPGYSYLCPGPRSTLQAESRLDLALFSRPGTSLVVTCPSQSAVGHGSFLHTSFSEGRGGGVWRAGWNGVLPCLRPRRLGRVLWWNHALPCPHIVRGTRGKLDGSQARSPSRLSSQ
jgi:hypothetical protein